MSFWDSALKVIGPIAGAVIGGVSNERAADQVGDASARAAEIQLQAQREAIEELRAGKTEALGRIDTALAQQLGLIDGAQASAIQQYQQLYDVTAPAVADLRNRVTAQPAKLTPSQQIGLDDLQRTTTNQLSAAGMRGAGRGGQAVMADTVRRYMANAYDQNQRRSDDATARLSSVGFGAIDKGISTGLNAASAKSGAIGTAGTVGANAAIGTSSNIANQTNRLGDVTSDLAMTAGRAEAGSTAASGRLYGETLGALGSIIANDQKDKGRPSSFLYQVAA